MVKFGRPRGKLEDERRREFLRKSVGGGGMVAEAGVREKGEGQREKFYERATGGRSPPEERTGGRQETKRRTLTMRKRVWRKRRYEGGPKG